MFVRQLSSTDWKAYRDIRLEALSLNGHVFGASLQDEKARGDGDWQTMLSIGTQAFFGLYDADRLAGITGIVTDTYAPDSRTAILIASYIREEYRKRGLSAKFYEARIGWARASGRFDRVVVSHREGNEASRRANQAFGFKLYCVEKETWGDGSKDNIYRYELRLT